jgi:hypothetical protein
MSADNLLHDCHSKLLAAPVPTASKPIAVAATCITLVLDLRSVKCQGRTAFIADRKYPAPHAERCFRNECIAEAALMPSWRQLWRRAIVWRSRKFGHCFSERVAAVVADQRSSSNSQISCVAAERAWSTIEIHCSLLRLELSPLSEKIAQSKSNLPSLLPNCFSFRMGAKPNSATCNSRIRPSTAKPSFTLLNPERAPLCCHPLRISSR